MVKLQLFNILLLFITIATEGIPSATAATTEVHARSPNRDLPASKASLQKILLENIMPWWIKHAVDSENGGFLLHHEDNNRYLGPNEKVIVTQARVMWFYSLLCSYPEYKTASNEAMARHGFGFLRDKMWDKRHGGFYDEVTHTGAPSNGGKGEKTMYGQSYGLYALSQYYIAFKDKEALELATKLFDLMIDHAHDETYGGFPETVNHDWTLTASTSKTFNTHMHVLEGVTTYFRASQDVRAMKVLEEILEPLTSSVVDPKGFIVENFNRDWSYSVEGNSVWFGHINEVVWLIIETCETINIDPTKYVPTFGRMWNFTMRYGWDEYKGGFNYQTAATLDQMVTDWKDWWTQAESLNTAIKMYRLTREQNYYDIFVKLLDFIEGTIVNWQDGEWHRQVISGRVDGLKAEPSKGPYHSGRAMVVCLDEIKRLMD